MKGFIGEILDPVKDFYKMRKLKETLFIIFVPVLFMAVAIVLSFFVENRTSSSIYEVGIDFFNQLITTLALFISFSMAYLSIILSSSSSNIDDLKRTESKEYVLDGKKCKLYHVLSIDLTYTLVAQIIFLMIVLFLKFLITVSGDVIVRISIGLGIAGIVHVLIMMLIIVKNVYYYFWRIK